MTWDRSTRRVKPFFFLLPFDVGRHPSMNLTRLRCYNRRVVLLILGFFLSSSDSWFSYSFSLPFFLSFSFFFYRYSFLLGFFSFVLLTWIVLRSTHVYVRCKYSSVCTRGLRSMIESRRHATVTWLIPGSLRGHFLINCTSN